MGPSALIQSPGRLKISVARAVELIVIGAVLLSTYFFARLGARGFISDSEIWSVNLAAHLGQEWMHPWVTVKPLFYGLLGLVTAPAADSISVFTAAKWLCLGNGVLILVLTYRLARTISGMRLVGWLAVLALLGTSGFINQGYRIRSDLFACSLILLALERTLRFARTRRGPSGLGGLKTALLWLTPFLATPKAILLVLPGLAFAPEALLWLKGRRLSLNARIQLALGGLAAFEILGILYGDSLSYFFRSFSPVAAGQPAQYWSSAGFIFVTRLLRRDFVLFGLILMRTLCLACRFSARAFGSEGEERAHRGFLVFCVLDAAIGVFAPERYPFLLAALLPPLAVYAVLMLGDVRALYKKGLFASSGNWSFALMAGVVVVTAAAFTSNAAKFYADFSENDTDRDQFEMIRYVETYLSRFPAAQYYDVIGIVPRRSTIRFFAGPHASRSNGANRSWILRHPPDLIFYTGKMAILEPEIGELLKTKYTRLDQEAYGRWTDVVPPITLKRSSLLSLKTAVDGALRSVGAATTGSPRARFEIWEPKTHGLATWKVVDATLEQLARDYFKPNSKTGVVNRVSAFTEFLDAPAGRFPEIFRFDWDH